MQWRQKIVVLVAGLISFGAGFLSTTGLSASGKGPVPEAGYSETRCARATPAAVPAPEAPGAGRQPSVSIIGNGTGEPRPAATMIATAGSGPDGKHPRAASAGPPEMLRAE